MKRKAIHSEVDFDAPFFRLAHVEGGKLIFRRINFSLPQLRDYEKTPLNILTLITTLRDNTEI